jgi:hypothetical protein
MTAAADLIRQVAEEVAGALDLDGPVHPATEEVAIWARVAEFALERRDEAIREVMRVMRQASVRPTVADVARAARLSRQGVYAIANRTPEE